MLPTALKEWAIVCDLMATGTTAVLLRKGGIHEAAGPGRFELEHQRFALYPAYEHERLDWIKPQYLPPPGRDDLPMTEPDEVRIEAFGEVTPDTIWPIPSRAAFDALDDLHPWRAPQIDMRFHYKPDRPLYLLAVRAYRLARPRTVPNRDDYAGCRSWVPLQDRDRVDTTGATPALSDEAFESLRQRITTAFALDGPPSSYGS